MYSTRVSLYAQSSRIKKLHKSNKKKISFISLLYFIKRIYLWKCIYKTIIYTFDGNKLITRMYWVIYIYLTIYINFLSQFLYIIVL